MILAAESDQIHAIVTASQPGSDYSNIGILNIVKICQKISFSMYMTVISGLNVSDFSVNILYILL
jgi:hypothetical protein